MDSKKKRRRWTLVAVLVLGLLGIGLYYYLRPDPQMIRVQYLRRQLTGEKARDLTPEQRRELGRELGEEIRQLSPEQRRELAKERQRGFREQVERFFKLSKKEQFARLDEQIDRMDAARRSAGTNGGPAGPTGNRGPTSPEDREHRRRQRLDETTPEDRALFAEYFQQLKNRRQQRGMMAGGLAGGGR